ncbi:MAG: GTP-binding protein [Patescibacteria group bacterium]
METQIPATVFTGFLGSGKTTVISHLVDQLQNADKQVVYIKNEIGSENVDAKIMEGKHIRTRELLNGCICCTLVGPFVNAISEIIEKLKPHRIIIEASGAADPAAIAIMIDGHPQLFRDGVITIVDVGNFEGYADVSQTARNQTKFTDLIVFNKIEAVNIERKRAVVDMVRELNQHSPIVEAPNGELAIDVAFGISSLELDTALKAAGFSETNSTHSSEQEQDQQQDNKAANHPHHDHLSQDGLESFYIKPSFTPTTDQLQHWLEALPSNIYRVKGYIQTADAGWVLLNRVGMRSTLSTTDASNHTDSVIVCIGFHIKSSRESIADSFMQLEFSGE